MRIVCISDTHSLHDNIELFNKLPPGDILIHAGDCTNRGDKHDVEQFVYWLQNLKGYDIKIFIAGNHDFAFEEINKPHNKKEYEWFQHLMNEENLSQSDVVYLEDSEYVINSPEFSRPIKIYGSPWQPEFYNWAFNLPRNGAELENKWKNIPDDTDILITHGPPHGIRDFTPNNLQVGCELLRFRVEQIKPTLHIFGHIHNAYGDAYINETLFINPAICNERYIPKNKPIVIELTEIDNILIPLYVEE